MFGRRERLLRAIRLRRPGTSIVRVEVRRPPDRVDRYDQELLLQTPDFTITLQEQPPDSRPVPLEAGYVIEPGALLLWYTFPGRPYEIGAFHDPEGRLLGHYVNIVRPLREVGPPGWVVEDLFLDIWAGDRADPQLLDEDEFEAAVRKGWISYADRHLARETAAEVMGGLRAGGWMPEPVERWTIDTVPEARVLRDTPGVYYASRASGRLIAWGLYVMGVVSATSVAFAAFTDAFNVRGPAQRAWAITIALEAALLAPLALGGKLPATRWPEPALVDERSLFVATLASSLAVLGLNDRTEWAGALIPIYAVLGLFSVIFAASRIRYDRQVPVFALAGLLVTVAALWLLL